MSLRLCSLKRAAVLLAAACALLVPAAASAHVFETFGFDPRGTAMGGAQVASADDFTGAFYNPALMVLQKDFKFGIGVAWAEPVTTVAPQNPLDAFRLDARKPPDYGGTTLGVLFPLGGKVQNRVALGVGLYLPWTNLLRTEAVDPNSPHWYLYQASPNRIIVTQALSVRLHDWVQIGAGAQVLADFGGAVNFQVDLFSKQFKKREIRNDLTTKVAPILGLSVDAKPIHARFGLSYRGSLELPFALPTKIDLGELGAMTLDIHGIAHFTPDVFTLGGQFDGIENLTLATELRYARWSRAPNPAVTTAVDLSGQTIDALGLGSALDMGTDDQSPGFLDTVSWHLGGEYKVSDRFSARLGYFFRPTPVPLQNGDMNILDSDTHGLSAGLGFNFDDPLEVFSKPIHIHMVAQRLILTERVAQKEKTSEVPPYTYSGHVNSLAAALRYEF